LTSTNQNLFIIKIEGMLQGNELRIGNWVDNDGYYQQIHFTDIADLSTGCGGAHLYKPIVLTPEILEKAGFMKVYAVWDGRDIDHRKDRLFIWGHNGCTDGHTVDFPCKFLHQLQNLYFALTGTELNINL
jgi:hypothetical protein